MDCDKLAVQSSEQTTWLLGYKRFRIVKHQDVALAQNELMVLRPYGGCPAFEITPTGDAAGLLIVSAARGATRSVRVGMKYRVELGLDESCTIRCEQIAHPLHGGVSKGAYGPGLAV
jgi:hypothetical protein